MAKKFASSVDIPPPAPSSSHQKRSQMRIKHIHNHHIDTLLGTPLSWAQRGWFFEGFPRYYASWSSANQIHRSMCCEAIRMIWASKTKASRRNSYFMFLIIWGRWLVGGRKRTNHFWPFCIHLLRTKIQLWGRKGQIFKSDMSSAT